MDNWLIVAPTLYVQMHELTHTRYMNSALRVAEDKLAPERLLSRIAAINGSLKLITSNALAANKIAIEVVVIKTYQEFNDVFI